MVVLKQVCTQGIVSFESPITATSGYIPRLTGPPFIAVNWYPFQTYSSSSYNKGRVYYRSTTSGKNVTNLSQFDVKPIQSVLDWYTKNIWNRKLVIKIFAAAHWHLRCGKVSAWFLWFLARDSIYAIALYAIALPSVCLSVSPSLRLSVTRMDQSKTVEVRIMQPSLQVASWL